MLRFTIDEIKSAHAKVKSGADFPAYIQEIKQLGVMNYEQFVTDGHVIYHGKADFSTAAPPKWALKTIAQNSDASALSAILKAHQAGETDYLTFCNQVAAIGVEKWVVDMEEMTCAYFDLNGNSMLVEQIPVP